MSALLEGFAVDGILPVTVGGSPPDHHKNGIPIEADGTIAVEMGAISHYSMGLPFTAAGRLAVDGGPVAYYGSGAAPMSAATLLVMGSGPVSHYSSGVPYGSDGSLVSTGLVTYNFNGIDQYATHAPWSSLGDPAVYASFAFSTDNPDGNIVNPTQPITEFGRNGSNYHDGSLSSLRYIDTSPIQDTSVKKDTGTLPGIPIEDADIEFDYIVHTSDEVILGGLVSLVSGVLEIEAGVTSFRVDGTLYGGATLNAGQHIHVSCIANTNGTLTSISALSGMQNLQIETTEYV